MQKTQVSPFKLTNIKMFIALRVLYNARFYYPVFTVLFLDYGLSIEQFAMLNVVWAITIVLVEVPSGALADILGRKILLVSTATIMIIEIAMISFVPLGNGDIIFTVFLINRILSGIAEAMASGADEAIAYDTLVETNQSDKWGHVLEIQMKAQSIGFIIAMALGSFIYDPDVVNTVLSFFGSDIQLTQQQTMRFPLYLTLISAFLAFIAVNRMKEPFLTTNYSQKSLNFIQTTTATLKHTLSTGKWILKTPFVFSVIIFGMLFDHSIRMIVTLTSQYYRLIMIPEALFGIIGSALSIIGFFIPKISRKMSEKYTPFKNMLIITILTVIGFFGISYFIPYFGVAPMIVLYAAFMMNGFFLSHYLNNETSSEKRATVLSFKGLIYNLSYGLIGFVYSILFASYKQNLMIDSPKMTTIMIENNTFIVSTGWFKWYFIVSFIAVLFFCSFVLKNTTRHKKIG